MRYIDELHCSSNNTAISTTTPIQCARFHVNSRYVPRSAADCLAEFILVAIVGWMAFRPVTGCVAAALHSVGLAAQGSREATSPEAPMNRAVLLPSIALGE